jgi:glucokinase
MPMDDGRNGGTLREVPWDLRSDNATIHDIMIAISSTNRRDKASEVPLSSGFLPIRQNPRDCVLEMVSKSLGAPVSVDFSEARSVLAFDVGGSHISVARCNLKGFRILLSARAPLPPDLSCEEFLDLVHRLGQEMSPDPPDPLGAVLAVPGPFDLAAGISLMQHKLKSLYRVDLKTALAERFGWQPTQFFFVNDAVAFLLGEVHCGAAQGAEKAIGVVLGTGIGSAFACEGRWVTQGDGIPPGGEIWNIPYGNGIIEDLLSTRAIKGEYAARTGKDEDVITIAAGADCDPEARAVFQTFGQHLGQVLRDVLAPFNPDVVVLGGGISRSAKLFLPFAQNQLNGFGFKLVTSRLLDMAPLVGAASYWRDDIGGIARS